MFESGCKCKLQTKYLRIEAEFGADPIWCNICNTNLDLSKIPLTYQLKRNLMDWAIKFGEWINWDTDELVLGALELESSHNAFGAEITKKIQVELGQEYNVIFAPSNMVYSYLQKK